MSWKKRRSTWIRCSFEPETDQQPFGEFVESVRTFAVSISDLMPERFPRELYLPGRDGNHMVRIDDPQHFLDGSIKHEMASDNRLLKDADGNKFDVLEPELFTRSPYLYLFTTDAKTSNEPSVSVALSRLRNPTRPLRTVVFNDFGLDLSEEEIDAVVEHCLSWWTNPRSVSLAKSSAAFDQTVRDASGLSKGHNFVYWKRWEFGVAPAAGPLPALVSQFEADGGTWTIVDTADEARAEPAADDPAVLACAAASRILSGSARLLDPDAGDIST